MWKHALSTIVCSHCKANLNLISVEEKNTEISEKTFENKLLSSNTHYISWVETGILYCENCKLLFPIYRGVPILLKFKTVQAELGLAACPNEKKNDFLVKGFHLPFGQASPGEEFVSASFSVEWENYDYGPVIWIASTSERLETFRGECGLKDGDLCGKRFIEIGCGLGILTNEAATGLGAEAWGMDISNAVFRATSQFRNNPNVHFVQASVFAAPFKAQSFDFLYSHGVLHHTWDTKEAITEAAKLLQRNGGCMYIWLYGYDDVRINLVRRVVYSVETVTRPLIARMPSFIATAVLLPLIPFYQIASFFGKRSGTHGSIYTPHQALHAARDRFSPLYAHRQEYEEVAGWLKELGFTTIQRVSRTEVSVSWGLAIERNIAIRGSVV